ncbi:hypothetical protein CSKR_106637 [Clonorchis sinensis]|uniref:Uncharacterized protein n=1 Tax=Clonorchis sinensis TaxID=79923 RepID=A0A3R7D391_CLOSI|nr:hypothetical protein CSKR_106637 [Clonorchis sinensis]
MMIKSWFSFSHQVNIVIRNALLIRLLKILRQPTTGFALLGAHQMSVFLDKHGYVFCERFRERGLPRCILISYYHISVTTPASRHFWMQCLMHRAVGGEMTPWLEGKFTDRKVRGSNPTSASRLPLSRLGQPDSILAPVLLLDGIAAGHRMGVTTEQ